MNKTKFKQTESGEIPGGWATTVLKNVAEVNEMAIDKNYHFGEIEYIDIASIDNGRVLEIRKLSREEAPSRAQRVVRDNDILLSTVRPNLKHFAFIKESKPNMIASTGFAVISAKKINSGFLYYYLTTNKYTNFLTAIADAHTSTYPAFNPDILENSEISYPSENEQRAIAKILSDLDEKIEFNHKINKTLKSIAQAIFKQWFVDFEFPGHEKAKFVDDLPKDWRHGALGEIITIESGKRPGQKSETKTRDFNVPLIGASSVMGFVKDALYNEPILIIGRVGTHGVVQRVSWPSFPSDNTLVIRSRYFEFVYQVLKTIDYEALNVGTTQPLITQTAINKYGVVIPGDEVLTQFETYISGLFKKVVANNQESEFLVEIRDSLLPRLMSGKIRITV